MSNKSVLSVLSDLSVLSVLCVLVDLSVLMIIVYVICQSSSKSHKYLTRVLQILPWWTTHWGLAISCEVNQSSVLSVTHVNIFYHLDFSERGSSKMGSLTQPPTRAELIPTCSLSASASLQLLKCLFAYWANSNHDYKQNARSNLKALISLCHGNAATNSNVLYGEIFAIIFSNSVIQLWLLHQVGDRFMDGNRIASVVYKECSQCIDYDTSYIVLPPFRVISGVNCV